MLRRIIERIHLKCVDLTNQHLGSAFVQSLCECLEAFCMVPTGFRRPLCAVSPAFADPTRRAVVWHGHRHE